MRHLVIIGSGPAGLTAAVYAARANLAPLLIEGWQSGGQLTTTTEVENFPGFSKSIMGSELMKEMRAQAERFGTEFLTAEVSAVDLKAKPFRLTIDGEQLVETAALIIATGASPIRLGIPNEARLTGHGVSTCATCDGYFFRGKDLVVVGGGDSAIEEAIFLTKFARMVTVVHRRDKLRASKILQDRAIKNAKISFAWNSIVEAIVGQDVVTSVPEFQRTCPVMGSSSPSATAPIRTSSPANSTWTRRVMCVRRRAPRPASLASLPPATYKTSSTDKP